MTDGNFDPRFNPAFQRGFEGQADATAAAPRPQASPPASLIGTPPITATPQVRPAQNLAPQNLAPRDSSIRDIPAGRATPSNLVDETDHYDDAPRRNPFLIALTVLAVALVGGGLLLISRLRDLFDDTTAGYDWVTVQVLTYGAPLLVALGLATGIGLLFVLALRRR